MTCLSYFKGLNNKQLSERIRLSFNTYDISKVSSSSHVMHVTSPAYDMSASFDIYDTSKKGFLLICYACILLRI